jgi:hypothetical protein
MATNISLRASQAFNPPGYGGETPQGSILPGSDPAFNAQGELNAYSKKDAVNQLRSVLDFMSRNASQGTMSAIAQAEDQTRTAEQRAQYFQALEEAFRSGEEGMRIVGQELLNPIREVLDYEGFARKVLAPREIGPGYIPRYDRDVYVTAWTIAPDGITPESRVQGKYVYPAEFLVTAQVTIDIRDLYQMQYDALARGQDRARQAIEFKEDSAAVNLLDTASTTVNSITYVTSFDWNALMDLKYQIERNRLPCDKFLINLSELRDMLKFINYQHFDPITMREIVLSGHIGNIAGVQLYASAGNGIFEPVPAGTVYAVSRPELVGGMPIRVPLQSEPTNRFLLGEPIKGFFFLEMISEIILNPRGVAKAVKL